jgi:hypothetical protein
MSAPLQVVRPALYGFTVGTLGVREPHLEWFPIDVSSAPIRLADPVKQVAGGGIQRASPTDTALLGFAATGNAQNIPTSIAYVNAAGSDSSGRNFVGVYVADNLTSFTGRASGTTSQANVMDTMDLQYAVTSPVVTVAVIGTTGSETDNYQVTGVTAIGEAAAPTAVQVTTGNATKTAANRNDITIPYTPLVLGYNIYRKISTGAYVHIGYINAVQPSTGTPSPTTVFSDTGQSAIDSALPPTRNDSGWLINNGADSVGIIQCTGLDSRGPGNAINPPGYGTLNGHLQFTVFQPKSQWLQVAGS